MAKPPNREALMGKEPRWSARSSGREIRVGLVIVLALAALIGLLGLAASGPGFLSDRRQIDVDFRDGQGIRPGSQVRIAGVESGRVVAVTLAEVDGALRARVRVAVPADLAVRLKEDARITIESSLTGQSRVNILSIGKSDLAMVPGKVLKGVETSMFDPVLEQVGLGPVERSNISHMIGQVRETIDTTGPQVRQIVGSVRETVDGLKQTSDSVRPVVASAVGHVDEATRRQGRRRVAPGRGGPPAGRLADRPARRPARREPAQYQGDDRQRPRPLGHLADGRRPRPGEGLGPPRPPQGDHDPGRPGTL